MPDFRICPHCGGNTEAGCLCTESGGHAMRWMALAFVVAVVLLVGGVIATARCAGCGS